MTALVSRIEAAFADAGTRLAGVVRLTRLGIPRRTLEWQEALVAVELAHEEDLADWVRRLRSRNGGLRDLQAALRWRPWEGLIGEAERGKAVRSWEGLLQARTRRDAESHAWLLRQPAITSAWQLHLAQHRLQHHLAA